MCDRTCEEEGKENLHCAINNVNKLFHQKDLMLRCKLQYIDNYKLNMLLLVNNILHLRTAVSQKIINNIKINQYKPNMLFAHSYL